MSFSVALLPRITVPLPEPRPGQPTYTEYGETDGVLGGTARAPDKVLPVGYAGFLRENGLSPTDVYATLFGDADVLVGRAVGGNDQFSITAATAVLHGDARLLLGAAQGGDDRIGNPIGGTGLPIFAIQLTAFGDAQVMAGRSRGGDDAIFGTSGTGGPVIGSNDLYGDAFALAGLAQGGDDTLTGGGSYPGSSNRLYGDGYQLSGLARGGDDVLVSGQYAANDFWGDAAVILGEGVTTGRDTFVISRLSGRNTIHDFEQGRDVIDLTSYAAQGIRSFEDLAARIELTDSGSYVFFSSTGGEAGVPRVDNSLTVLDVFALTADDFLFA